MLHLLHAAFEYQKDRIDPPSSLYRLDEQSLARKIQEEQLIIARQDSKLVGCVFVQCFEKHAYLGKLAVLPQLQGNGIGRLLMYAVEDFVREHGHTLLELETRIELIENHETFAKLGFRKVSEHAHEGYDHPTFIKMQKWLT